MTQTILKAIMRLFALITNLGDENGNPKTRGIVESYLNQQVRKQEVNQYLIMYDFYLKSMQKKGKVDSPKRLSLNSVKILLICEQINSSLKQYQKIFILLELFEIINSNRNKTQIELEFLKTIALSLYISNEDYENTKAFILENYVHIPIKEGVLVINNNLHFEAEGIKHTCNENLLGELVFLHYSETNIFVFRQIGRKDNLMINNREIDVDKTYILEKGGSIHSHRIEPIFYSDIVSKFLLDSSKYDFVFTAEDIEFRFPDSTNGIEKMNFTGQSGQLIGIMGGSGVGKSTLLNVFNGSLKPQHGRILINGFDIHNEKEKVKGIIGFIPQDDLLIEELTVYQNLYYNARLCFKNFTEEEIVARVKRVLTDLGLYNIRRLTVGSPLKKFISGGQRKRLNIALELIREPFILLVDEPTSGLSSSDSETVMDLFKDQALKGKLIIINIHQPSSDIFKLFDQLFVLDQGGRAVYFGNPVYSLVYFKTNTHLVNASESECLSCGNVNPEQLLQIIEAKNVNHFGQYTETRKISPEQWYEMYQKNIESRQELDTTRKEIPRNQFQVPGIWKQFKIFAERNILSKLADRQFMTINLLEAPLLAIILGFFTKYISGTPDNPTRYVFSENENIPAFLFMSIIVALFLGLMVSAEEIIRDRKILKRESFLNLSWSSYLHSKIVFLFLLSAIQTISFVILGNLILGIKGMMLSYWLILFSTSCFANMLGLIISANLKSVVAIYITIPMLLVPQLLFAGVIVKFDKLHKNVTSQEIVPIIGDIMASRWAYEALAVNQFKNNNYQVHFYDIEKQESQAAFSMNYLVPELLTKLSISERYYKDEDKKKMVSSHLQTVQNEITKLTREKGFPDFPYLASLNYASFNVEVSSHTKSYLNNVKKYYSKKLDESIQQKDNQVLQLIKKFDGKDKFLDFKRKYYNTSLADQVLNKFERNKIIEIEHKLIQKSEPIFKTPTRNSGRAHFYSPTKLFAGYYIQTEYFNIFALWIMTGLVYFLLRFSVFTKTKKVLIKIKCLIVKNIA